MLPISCYKPRLSVIIVNIFDKLGLVKVIFLWERGTIRLFIRHGFWIDLHKKNDTLLLKMSEDLAFYMLLSVITFRTWFIWLARNDSSSVLFGWLKHVQFPVNTAPLIYLYIILKLAFSLRWAYYTYCPIKYPNYLTISNLPPSLFSRHTTSLAAMAWVKLSQDL